MRAFRLQQVDKEYHMHLQAWLNHVVTSTKEVGKKQVPVYKKFNEFFDYSKRLKEVQEDKKVAITPEMRRMAQLASKLNSEGG